MAQCKELADKEFTKTKSVTILNISKYYKEIFGENKKKSRAN